ncbi:MAG: CsbD family protein [Pseudomonadota bacterium]
MDKDRIVGSAKVVAGKAKAAVGAVIGDAKLEAEGKADQVEGRVQNAVGSAKDTVRDVIKGK